MSRTAIVLLSFMTASGLTVSACGDDTGSNNQSDGGAGAGGAPEDPDAGGSANAAGNPADDGGAGGAPGSSGGAGDGGSGGVAGSAGAGGGEPETDPEVQAYFDALPTWPSVPPGSDTPSATTKELRYLKTDSGGTRAFSCDVQTHDIIERRDEILNFDSNAEYIRPGALLSGNDFLKGQLTPINLPRAPITLTINVPGVPEPSVTIANPTLATIQQGIATLQARAHEATMGSSYAANLTYDQKTVQSVEEMSYALEASAAFDGALAGGSFAAAFQGADKTEKYTVASRLMQQMYSITFTHDTFATARDFFSNALTIDQLTAAEKDGYLGPDNTPVFIGSVTYGRMVIFTATSTAASSSTDLTTTLNASGVKWSAQESLTAEQKNFMASLDIQVLSIGGNQADVSNAIRTGNWSDLYAGADILNSVPLTYTVRALTGVRPVAFIGSTTQFKKADCKAAEPWVEYPGPANVIFKTVSTNPQNNPVFAIGQSGGNSQAYRFDGSQFTLVPSDPLTTPLVTVDEGGNAFIQHAGKLWKMAPGGSWSDTGAASSQYYFDAGAANWLVALSNTYSGDQNDLYYWDGASGPWAFWLDDAQNMKQGQAPWFTAVGKSYIGRHDGGLYQRFTDGTPLRTLSVDTTELNTVGLYSAASATEVYAVRTATNEVVKFNVDTKKFDNPKASPGGSAISDLDAASSGRLWIVTTEGKIFNYAPAP